MTESERDGGTRWLWAITLGLLALLVGLYFVVPGYRELLQEAWRVLRSGEDDAIARWFREFGVWGPLLVLALMLAQTVVFVLPSWLPMIVAALAYGAWWGTLLSVVGVAAVSSLAYAVGVALGTATLDRFVSAKGRERLGYWVERYGIGAVALFRVSPFLSNDGISFVAGLVRMGYLRFLLATLMGIVPLAAAIGWFADDIDRLRNGLLWIGGAGLLLYAGFVWIDHRKRPDRG